MSRFVFRTALMVALVIYPALGHTSEKLRIATEGAYPPFNFINEEGKLDGFDVDLAWALCKAMNVECELIAVPWADIIDGLVADKYDTIIASMAKCTARPNR